MNKRILLIPDCHIPFEDRRAYNLMLKVAEADKANITEIILLGDYADFFNINSHSKDLAIHLVLKDELGAVARRLKELRNNFPKAKIVYIIGNHEYRLERYIANKAQELFSVVELSDLLRFSELNIEPVSYGPNQEYRISGTDWIARHEPTKDGSNYCLNTIKEISTNTIMAHTHRFNISTHYARDRKVMGISLGWLGDKHQRAFSYPKAFIQWSLGFGFLNVINSSAFIEPVEIILKKKKYYCYSGGKLYEN